MRAKNFYSQTANRNKNLISSLLTRAFIFTAFFISSMPYLSWASPTFMNSSPQNITVCGNLSIDISSYLSVMDAPGTNETWDIIVAPGHGTLGGLPTSAVVGSSMATPSGVTYTPDAGFSGSDNFAIEVGDGMGGFAVMAFNVTVNPGPTLTLGAMPSVCMGTSSIMISFSNLTNIGSDTAMFTSVGTYTWGVPAGISSINFDVQGASGGNDNYSTVPNPGKGGRVQGMLAVSSGQVLNIRIGSMGGNGTASGATGGFNGGANATFYFFGCGGAGGGASDIRLGGVGLANRVVVAGGGGGSGADGSNSFAGGNGGGVIGGSSANNLGGSHATGGTQSAGGMGATYTGWASGSNGMLLNGGAGSSQGISGGGGGGYFGGGGGVWTGGAGGSSYTSSSLATSVMHTQGFNTGNGNATIIFTLPGTYSIVWTPAANAAGFANVTNAPMTSFSSFTIAVPSPAITTATTYNGVLTISNGICTSTGYPISVTIKPVPSVNAVSNIIVCNGDSTGDINFTNPTFYESINNNWANNNTSIGLGALGTGHINSFHPVNTTTFPDSAIITVTPVSASGCTGMSQSFKIIDNPIPTLTSTLTPPGICNNTMFSYAPTSSTPGTTFAWSRAVVPGISNGAASGIGNINEILNNTWPDPVVDTYTYTLSANGCMSMGSITVMVNPTPMLLNTTAPSPVCDSTLFSYLDTLSNNGIIATWSRAAVSGISNPAAMGSGSIGEYLHNTTNAAIPVTYVYTLNINGCTTTTNVIVSVNPKPTLTSTLMPSPICDSALFMYIPMSSVAGTSVRWGRATSPYISNPAASGMDTIREYLHNTATFPVIVTYMDTLMVNGCMNMQNVMVTVNPTPKLSSSLTMTPACTGMAFSYTPTSGTGGTTYVWTRDNVTGISNPPAMGTYGVSETLINTTTATIMVPYLYTLSANGCAHQQTVTATIYPTPMLSNTGTSSAICDSALFSFSPTSATSGATFAWYRPYVAGIFAAAASGTGNPNERLKNTTNIDVTVTYQYTITANGCSGMQNVMVTVHPKPALSSTPLTRTICSGDMFNYTPSSYTPSTSFAWSRANVSGILPSTSSGTGNISETLTNSTTGNLTTMYVYTLTVSGCTNKQNVTVNVNSAPAVPVIGTNSAANVCSNTRFANFGAATAPPSGYNYTWSATNATIWAVGSNGQYAIVSFNMAGTAVVTLTSWNNSTSCKASTNYTVNVSSAISSTPEVIYYNSQFICKQTNVDTYQWGYDDVGTLQPHDIAGETNQNFYEPAPDFDHKYYWVKTTNGVCTQKTYYNPAMPAGVEDINAMITEMKVYPNPANNIVNIMVNTAITGTISIELSNMLGQKLNIVNAIDNKAQFDVSKLPAGCYFVECISDGVKIAAAKFIKN